MSDANLKRLIRKLKYHDFCKEWCGHVTPVETLWLHDNGALTHGLYKNRDYVENKVKWGIGSNFTVWFTVQRQSNLEKIILENMENRIHDKHYR